MASISSAFSCSPLYLTYRNKQYTITPAAITHTATAMVTVTVDQLSSALSSEASSALALALVASMSSSLCSETEVDIDGCVVVMEVVTTVDVDVGEADETGERVGGNARGTTMGDDDGMKVGVKMG